MKYIKFLLKYLLLTREAKGFTLLEILLAIFISSIVIAGAGYGVVAVVEANRISEQKTTRRVELNRALDYISEDIKGAKVIDKVVSTVNGKTVQIMRIMRPDPYPSFPTTLPTTPTIQYIDYYFEDVSSDSGTVWVKPGIIRRQEYYDTRTQSNATSPPTAGTVQTLVDGISKTLPATITSPPSCTTSDFIADGGFFACINEEFRTVSLSLYGVLNTSSNNQNVLLVSSKFVTRNIAPRDLCIIPNFVTSPATTADQGANIWTSAGFTGTYNRDGTGNFNIASQNATAGASIPCSGAITVASSLCTVGNYVGQTTSAVETTYNTQGFVNPLVKNGNSAGFTVFSQDPAAGQYPCSQVVTVTEATCTLPDLTNQTITQAQTNWTTNQFTGTITKDALDPTSNYTIAEQSLPAGSYFCSSNITLSERKCDVPDYLTSPTSTSTLGTTWNSYGGTIVTTPDNSGSTVYTIGNQSLTPGSKQFCSQPLTVQKSNTCTVPNVIGMTSTNAQSTLNSSPLSGAIITEANTSPFVVGSLKNSSDDSAVTVGSTINCSTPLTLVEKKCTVPNLSGTSFASVPSTWNSDGGAVQKIGTFTTVGGQSLTVGSSEFCSKTLEVSNNSLCTVPNFIASGATDSSINSLWSAANFTGTITRSSNGDADLSGIGTLDGVTQNLSSLNYRIFNQSLTAGQSLSCTSNITLSNNPPANLAATTTDITVITSPTQYNYNVSLSWDAVPGATQYKLFACPSPINSSATSCVTSPNKYPNDYTPIYTGTETSFSHLISFTTNNNTQKACYSIQATRGELDAKYSVVSPLVCLANNYLNAPTGFTRTNNSGNVNNATVTLNWNGVTGANGYRVYGCTANTGTCDPKTGNVIATISSGSTITYTNTGVDLNGNKNACYLVTAYRGTNSSPIGDSAILCGRI